MKTILFLFLCFSIISCKKKSDYISNAVEIKVLNSQGQNLLSTPSMYDESNIKIYYMVNGQAELYNPPQYNAGKPFTLIKAENGEHRLRVFLHFVRNEKTALTLIKFGDTKMDTIKAEFRFDEGTVVYEKIWLNGMLKTGSFNIIK